MKDYISSSARMKLIKNNNHHILHDLVCLVSIIFLVVLIFLLINGVI